MNLRSPKLTLTCALMAVSSATAFAQINVPLTNPGFEQPGTSKIATGFDVPGADVPGWNNTGMSFNYTDTGIESTTSPGNPSAHGGTWRSFGRSQDGGAFQISNYQIQEGDVISLTWFAYDGWNNSVQTVSLLSGFSPTDAFNETGVLATRTDGLVPSWNQFTLEYTATPGDVGNFVGISFINGSLTPNNWAAWDDFSLTVTPVPEPGTIGLAILGTAIGALALRRRRS